MPQPPWGEVLLLTRSPCARCALRRCLFSGHAPPEPDPPAGLIEGTTLITAFYKRQARALLTQATSAASLHARDHRARLESELRSVRRQRGGQQRVADKDIDLRHVVDAKMPANFLIKIYHLNK